mmetsp:Transcript_13586/g.13163  ORF Transcript_13586/g.13163 Transcript_13586/m.13163 type:complete len:260 (-) Transcript_13586:91-870(-)
MVEKVLTSVQAASLEKMRQTFRVSESCGLPLNDATFLRYLHARSFDFTKSSAMLQATLKWRSDFGLKDMLSGNWTDIIQKENTTGKIYIRGFSKAGQPLMYMTPRNENTNDHDGNLKHLVYHMERICAISEAADNGNDKIILLIDYDGYKLGSTPMKTSKETLSILQNHYPERLKCAYCIRPPWIFNAFFTLISPFIDPLTKAKVKLLKGDDARIQLLKEIHGAVLETSVGGEDKRPFNSKMYLEGDFKKCFASILEKS